jgi:hypothetical protein
MALKAYFEGKISRNLVSKLQLFDCMQQHHKGFAIHQLTKDYIDIIIESFLLVTKTPDKKMIASTSKKRLADKIKNFLPKKTQFFTYPIDSSQPTNSLFLFKHQKQTSTFVLPPKLANIINKIMFGPTYMKINSVLGYSQPYDFIHEEKRDALIPCRYVTNPIMIHNTLVGTQIGGLYIHDNQHALTESANPERALWLKLASWVEQKGNKKLWSIGLDRAFFAYIMNLGTFRSSNLRVSALSELIKKIKEEVVSPNRQLEKISLIHEYFSTHKEAFPEEFAYMEAALHENKKNSLNDILRNIFFKS